MKSKLIFPAVTMLFALAISCKKENPVQENIALLQDGPMSATLGKLLYLGADANNSLPVWGRNANELYMITDAKILRMDLLAQKKEIKQPHGGLLVGKTNENSGLVFIGKLNSQNAYYQYNFSSENIETIFPVPLDQGTIINVAGNHIFYYTETIGAGSPPCNGFCIPYPTPAYPGSFYYYNKITKVKTDLPGKHFLLFSKDGNKSLLASNSGDSIYRFDNNARTVIDSFDLPLGAFRFGLYYDDVLRSFDYTTTRELIIKNFITGQVLQQGTLALNIVENLRFSADGTKLYYSGGQGNGSSMVIAIYDLVTKQEKIIADVPYLYGGATPVEYFVLSDDNRKMLFRYQNDLYIKALD